MIAGVNLRQTAQLAGAWRDLWNEARWRFSGEGSAAGPISFPLEEERLRNLEIRWPVTYQWAGAGRFVEGLARGLRRFVTVRSAEIPQTYRGIVQLQAVWRGKTFGVTIDYSDFRDQIDENCLSQSAVYFKMQYRREGYSRGEAGKIVPGGYINGHPRIYEYLPHVRRAADSQTPRYQVYGRFGLQFEARRKAVELLERQTEFRYEGGLKMVRYSRFLLETAAAQICIDLPGYGDLCSRLADYLAVGACIVGPRHGSVLHVPLEDRKHIVYARSDLSDLVPLCKHYLENHEERDRLRRNAPEYFDRYLHREQLAAYYLQQCLARLE